MHVHMLFELTLQLYNHDFMCSILINAHDYIIFISNTTIPILFTTMTHPVLELKTSVLFNNVEQIKQHALLNKKLILVFFDRNA